MGTDATVVSFLSVAFSVKLVVWLSQDNWLSVRIAVLGRSVICMTDLMQLPELSELSVIRVIRVPVFRCDSN